MSIKVAERKVEPLSAIIRELNLGQLMEGLAANEALAASVQVDTPENARLTFQHVPNDLLRTRSKGGGP